MKKSLFLLAFSCLCWVASGMAQQVIYSQPDREDPRTLNFEVLGKIGGNILVYKNYRDVHFMAVFNNEMQQIQKKKLDFANFRLLGTDFIAYPDFAYMIYQYQHRSIIYCMAAKLDGNGNLIGKPVQMDSTEVNFSANNRIYSFLCSEDKQKIMVFKINGHNNKEHVLTTSLFTRDLQLIYHSVMRIPMPQRNDFLSEFSLDNEGNLICIRASGTSTNDNINKVSLIIKGAETDRYTLHDLNLDKIFLDDIRIKVDNLNKHYLITSFLSRTRRGNIDGLYYALWDKKEEKELLNATTIFTDEFREDARNEGSVKTAFNDFFLKNIILRKDGGFLILSESAYTSSRGNTMNRWDYLYGSPYWAPMDYYSWYSPIGYYPWWQYSMFNNQNSLIRYYADNIAVLSFDPQGKMEWSNVIRKSQFDDNTDNYIGFGLINTGTALHFLFNVQEKRNMILSDQSITPSGQVDRSPTFKNLDRGYDFMPRHAKQTGAHQVIIPCQYRGFTCFAKIEF
ncbi:MAG TPA: hypothetical protein VG842_09655 [Sediminibacterium sp.]|nr:hypothetical protein [Sediminibacterium sp.]